MVAVVLILSRGLHLGSGLLLLTVVAFRGLILRPAFRDASEEEWAAFAPLGRRLNGIFIWAQGMLGLSAVMLFGAVAAGMSGQSLGESLNLETWKTVALETQFGHVFLIRLGLAILLALLTWLAITGWQSKRGRSALETAAAMVAAGLLVSFAFTGHAAASSGTAFGWNVAADAIHLAAAAIWPAGLFPFALFLADARSLGAVSPAVLKAVGRFSGLSLVTVFVLTASGLVNAWFLVGSLRGLFHTPYGWVLLSKLLLFLIILGIAGWNRFRILPLLFSRTTSGEEQDSALLLGPLRRFVLAEFVLAVGVLLAANVLGTLPPAR